MVSAAVLFSVCNTLLFGTSCALYHHSKVQNLDGSKFNEVVHGNERPFMVEFFAPYCGHCKQMVPAYSKLAENLEGLVDVAAIDCQQPFNRPVCERYAVQGYPTIKLFVFNGKGVHKRPIDYNHERTVGAMSEFIKKNMHSFIFQISAKEKKSGGKWAVDLDGFFSKGGSLPKLVLFKTGPPGPSTLLFRALSIKYHYKIVVGEISIKNDPALAEQFGIRSTDMTLVYFPTGAADSAIKYTGPIKRKEIFAFLNDKLSNPVSASSVVKGIRVAQLQSGEDLKSTCLDPNLDLCVVVSFSAATQDLASEAIDAVLNGDYVKDKAVAIAKLLVDDRVKFIRNLGDAQDLPSATLIASKTKGYARMTREFKVGSFASFLSDAASGKLELTPYASDDFFLSDSADGAKVEL